MGNKSKRQGEPQPITRRQQIAALRQMKAEEVAANLGDKIREAVRQEVNQQLKAVKDTVLNCIDRVMEVEAKIAQWDDDEPVTDAEMAEVDKTLDARKYHCNKCGYLGDTSKHDGCDYFAVEIPVLRKINEGDSDDRPERAETTEVSDDTKVVREPVVEGPDDSGQDSEESPPSRGLYLGGV